MTVLKYVNSNEYLIYIICNKGNVIIGVTLNINYHSEALFMFYGLSFFYFILLLIDICFAIYFEISIEEIYHLFSSNFSRLNILLQNLLKMF